MKAAKVLTFMWNQFPGRKRKSFQPDTSWERTRRAAAYGSSSASATPARAACCATAWTAGHTLVADSFGRGRVFIGGDAAHLFTPTGGLGYNTAIEDAVNLGWKLAAVLKGQAHSRLLESYGAERRPLALRNTAHAKR